MKRIIGIELGSTRIKAVLTDENAAVLAQGGYEWENVLVDGLWSYPMDEVEKGLQAMRATKNEKDTENNNISAFACEHADSGLCRSDCYTFR